jgi:hypothetical protein
LELFLRLISLGYTFLLAFHVPLHQPAAPAPGVHIAEADLKPNQIQDLADIVADLVHAAAGHDLKFRVRIELRSGDLKSTDTLTKINKALKEVVPEFQLNCGSF